MQSFRYGFLIALLLLIATACPGAAAQKKLIEFGWDEPDTSFLRQHIAEMEQTPFDGCVFHVQFNSTTGAVVNLCWEGWSHRVFSEAELAPALADLKATELRRFTHNFLRFNVTPGDVDWFGDFTAVVNNARLAARLAHDGKAAGILFDIEAYNAPLFDFTKLPHGEGKQWTNYTAQVRARGAELMNAFQEGYPGLIILLTFGYTISWEQMLAHKQTLSEVSYALLPALLDGMLAAAHNGAQLVDGCESAYGYKDHAKFERQLTLMKTGVLPIVADPAKYAKTMSFGFGLWLDNNSQKLAWDTNDFSKNYFTPETFQASVQHALQLSDEYVWIYTEKPKWWTPVGGSTNLPVAYEQATRRARQSQP